MKFVLTFEKLQNVLPDLKKMVDFNNNLSSFSNIVICSFCVNERANKHDADEQKKGFV